MKITKREHNKRAIASSHEPFPGMQRPVGRQNCFDLHLTEKCFKFIEYRRAE
jgi:hypothetical protein